MIVSANVETFHYFAPHVIAFGRLFIHSDEN